MITYSGLRLYFFSFSSKWDRSLRSAPMIQKRSELRLWASEQSESEANTVRHFGNASIVKGGILFVWHCMTTAFACYLMSKSL